jgi:transcriptional regulator
MVTQMYIPKHFAETRLEVLHDLIEQHPLGTLIVPTESELIANNLPFLIDRARGPFGTLQAHVARANPVWKMPLSQASALVCFQGFNSYISPNWYPSKKEHGKVVPTWNYITVAAHGHPRFIEDKFWLLDFVTRLTNKHESTQPTPWQVTDAPADYIADLLGAIVGVEMVITKLDGKWKASQNRTENDRLGIHAGLRTTVEPVREIAEKLAPVPDGDLRS